MQRTSSARNVDIGCDLWSGSGAGAVARGCEQKEETEEVVSQSMDPVANVAGAPGGTAGSQAASVVCPNCQVTPETVDPGWKPIRLRFVGTEERVACAFADCRHPIASSGTLQCNRCQGTMCRQHHDDQKPAYCKVCAEEVRAEEFEKAAQGLQTHVQAGGPIGAVSRITQSAPSFRARIWTEPGMRPTTRDICTVPRDSKGCYQIGAQFTLNVQTERDCYLWLLDVGTSGNVCVLLNNYRLRAGAPVTLSGPDQSHEWVISGPPGVERIKAMFTARPAGLFPGVDCYIPLQPEEAVAKIEQAGAMLEGMPADSWTDAICQFAIFE